MIIILLLYLLALGDFPSTSNSRIARVAGQPLHITCSRPESFPTATILWSKKTSLGWQRVDYNDRVIVDPDGMYFEQV